MGIADLRGAVDFFRKESTAVSRAFVHTDTAKEGLHRSRQTNTGAPNTDTPLWTGTITVAGAGGMP